MKAAFIGALFAVFVSLARSADAAMITETYTFGPLVGYNNESGTSFAEFNPALGTLNSVTTTFTATATWSGGGAFDPNEVVYEAAFNGAGYPVLSGGRFGVGSVSLGPTNNTTDNSLGSLSNLIGSGFVTTSVGALDFGFPYASISSTFGTETLTYNYTPVAAVPEPASLALFGAGLLGLGFFHRRKRA